MLLRLKILIPLIVCLLLASVSVGLTSFALQPITAEAGEPIPSAEAFARFSFLPLRVQTDMTDASLAMTGTHEIRFRLLFVPLSTTLTVLDTVPPAAVAVSPTVFRGAPVSAGSCVGDIDDATSVRVSFVTDPDTAEAGKAPVSVRLTDEAGNSAVVFSSVNVLDVPYETVAEAGSDEKTVLRAFGLSRQDCSVISPARVDTLPVGTHDVTFSVAGTPVSARLDVRDTVAPSAVGKNVLTFLGAELNPDPIAHADKLLDASPVTAEYAFPPDYSRLGVQDVTVILTDASGNASRIEATLTVSREVPPPTITGAADQTVIAGCPLTCDYGVTAADYAGRELPLVMFPADVNVNEPGVYPMRYSATDDWGNTVEAVVEFTVEEPTYELVMREAREVLSGILTDGMNDRARARAVFDWMTDKENVSYRISEEKDRWLRAAHYGFVNRCGDCYVYYAMTRALLDAADVTNLEITRNDTEYLHYWNLVYIPDEGWYHLDTCPHFVSAPLESFLLTNWQVRYYSRYYVAEYYTFDPDLYPEIN